MTYSPTVRRRRLSAGLRRFRDDAGLTVEQAARSLGWAASKVSRIERNEWKLPSGDDVRDLLALYNVTDPDVVQAMVALAREARRRGWWEEYKDVLGGSLPEFEAEASQIHTYQVLHVPGLLQTPEYAAAIFRGGQVVEDALVQRRVVARMERQRILERPNPPLLWVVIDEAALTKHIGGVQTMCDQLRHLRDMAERPNITIQVLPDTAGAHAGMGGPFTILAYDSPEDPPLVYIEVGAPGDLYLEGAEEVVGYWQRCNLVRASAYSADKSATYLEKLIKQFTT